MIVYALCCPLVDLRLLSPSKLPKPSRKSVAGSGTSSHGCSPNAQPHRPDSGHQRLLTTGGHVRLRQKHIGNLYLAANPPTSREQLQSCSRFLPCEISLRLYPYPLSRQKTGIFKVDLSPSVKAVGTERARRVTAVPTATPYTSAGVL